MNNTNTHNYLADPLWSRIEAYPIDNPDAAHPFSAKLAAEQGWTKTFTLQAIEEYKKFIYLCCISPTGASPGKVVDEVWHQHLTYTTDYWIRFCKNTLHKDIHHFPSQGGTEEIAKHTDWYDNTIELYNTTFGSYPPEHIWPGQKHRDVPEYEEEERPFAAQINYAKYAVLLIPFVLITLFFWQPNPFHLSGPHFLVFFITLAICTISLQADWAAGKKKLLKNVLNNKYHDLTKYEKAWLSGGTERIALLMVVELIDKEIITLICTETYNINYDKMKGYDHPLAESLKNIDHLTKASARLKEVALYVAGGVEIRPVALKEEYDSQVSKANWLTAITAAIGILRFIQGESNDKPTGFLFGLLIAFGFVALTLRHANKFHPVCNKILRSESELPEALETDITNQVILYGIAPLLILPLYSHMRTDYNNPIYGGDSGSSGGGCSSGDGGGCGGGCGGCGGS